MLKNSKRRSLFIRIFLLIVFGFSLITGNITNAHAEPNEQISVNLTWKMIYGYNWPLGASLYLTIDDPSNGVGIDYSDTRTVTSGGVYSSASFFIGNFNMKGGDIIVMTDGVTPQTYTIAMLTIDSYDEVLDQVIGSAEPGSQIIVYAYTDEYADPESRTVTTDQNGKWMADFSVGPYVVDIKPGAWGEADQFDLNLNYTSVYWYDPLPTITVDLILGEIDAGGWPYLSTVTLTIDDPSNGPGTDYSETDYVNHGVSEYAMAIFWPEDFKLRAGQLITISGSSITRSFRIALSITQVDIGQNSVSGVADPGSRISLSAGIAEYPDAFTDQNGNWSAYFAFLDIVPGTTGKGLMVNLYGDKVQFPWHALKPRIDVIMPSNKIQGVDWTIGDSVHLSIDDPTNGVGVDYSSIGVVGGSYDDSLVEFDLTSFQLKPGQEVTLSDGSTIRTHIIANLILTEVSQLNNSVMGTADPGSVVSVLACDYGRCTSKNIITDQNGNWFADYNGSPSYDILQGTSGQAFQQDSEGNNTIVPWKLTKSFFISMLGRDFIVGFNWLTGIPITMTIDDPLNGIGIDYTDTITSTEIIRRGWVYFNLTNFKLRSGQIVKLTNGIETLTYTISLKVNIVDNDKNIVSGNAEPGTQVYARVNPPNVDRYITPDINGNWIVDFSTGGGTADIIPGSTGYVSHTDENGNGSRIFWEALPALSSVTPSSIATGTIGASIDVFGNGFIPSFVIRWNGKDLNTTYVSPTQLHASVDGSDLNQVGTAVISAVDPFESTGGVSNGLIVHITNFSDVPYDYSITLGGTSYPLHDYIQALFDAGYTAGCLTNPLRYCPNQTMTRAESAVFMLRGQFGSGYTPPAAPWDTFADNWNPGTWAEKWAEGMWVEGMTAGCLTNPLRFCPWDQFPRVQAAVFGLRMMHGMLYNPPAASGTVFTDMTDTGYYGTKWAEQAYIDGLLPACGTQGGKPLFCPNDLVTRAWGAYLIVQAKDLPLTP